MPYFIYISLNFLQRMWKIINIIWQVNEKRYEYYSYNINKICQYYVGSYIGKSFLNVL